jgi:hypothetical protein
VEDGNEEERVSVCVTPGGPDEICSVSLVDELAKEILIHLRIRLEKKHA